MGTAAKLIADDRRAISYRPRFARLTGSVLAAILLQQMIYRWDANESKQFFKFKEPCKNKDYRQGDSWCEELGFTRYEFDGALKLIATKIVKGISKTIAMEWSLARSVDFPDDDPGFVAAMELSIQHLIIYWTDSNRRTWYWVNSDLLDKVVEQLYLDKSDLQLYLGKVKRQLYLLSEMNTEDELKDNTISQPLAAREPESVKVFEPALKEELKSKRKAKTLTDPYFVFQTIDGKSVYTGPFKALEAAKRFASGHGTVTQRQAIPPGATTRPVPKVVQPWDVLGKAVARVFFGATDDASINAVFGRVAPILHGDKRSGRCIGIIEYECQRQKRARDELDYEALAAFAPVVWAYYQTKNPDKPLKDCAKIVDYWQARRALDIPNTSRAHFEEKGPNPYNPNPNLSVLRLVEP